MTRVDRATFDALLTLLKSKGKFINAKYLSRREKLLMFILVLVGNSTKGMCERWQHSGSTSSQLVHEVAAIFYAVSIIFSSRQQQMTLRLIKY